MFRFRETAELSYSPFDKLVSDFIKKLHYRRFQMQVGIPEKIDDIGSG